MADNHADFTLTFRRLGDALIEPEKEGGARSLFDEPKSFDDWATKWRAYLSKDPKAPQEQRAAMRRVNPAFIPRNHMVEEMIVAAVEREDFTPFESLISVLEKPFEDQPTAQRYADPPLPEQIVHKTFCGT
jgi:uncharacterized protein YdiU (UPF0061 family)